MGVQIRHILLQRPSSPAAAWYVLIFFTQILHIVQHLCKKRWLLPPCRRRNYLLGEQPRNSCYLTGRTRCTLFWSVDRAKSRIRLRQRGTLFSFAQKNSRCEFFCAKDLVSSALPEAIAPVKHRIAGYMSALADSRFSLISRRSWSKLPPHNSCYLTPLAVHSPDIAANTRINSSFNTVGVSLRLYGGIGKRVKIRSS